MKKITKLTVVLLGIVISLKSYSQTSAEYLELGVNEMKSKNFSTAIAYMDKAIKLNPNNELAYLDRALCRMTRGEWEKAIPDCDKAIALNPMQAVAYFVRGSSKANLKRNGCSDFKKALSLGYTMAQRGVDEFCR